MEELRAHRKCACSLHLVHAHPEFNPNYEEKKNEVQETHTQSCRP